MIQYKKKSAFAMITVLTTMMFLSVSAVSFVKLSISERNVSSNYVDRYTVNNAAQQGIEYAIARIIEGATKDIYSCNWLGRYPDEDTVGNPEYEHTKYAEDFTAAGASLSQLQNCSSNALSFFLESTNDIAEDVLGHKVSYMPENNKFCSLKVLDTTSQINLNMDDKFLGQILDNLSMAVALRSPYKDVYGDKLGPLKGLGQTIVKQRPKSGFHDKNEMIGISDGTNTILQEDFEIIKDYLTTFPSINELQQNEMYHMMYFPIVNKEDTFETVHRSPINLNSASWPVLVAIFMGLKCSGEFNAEISREEAIILANRICLHREQSFFKDWNEFDDFLRVEGDNIFSSHTFTKKNIVKANAAPFVSLKYLNPDSHLYQFVNKADLEYFTTEFCFFPTGEFEITSQAKLVHAGDFIESELTTLTKVYRVVHFKNQKQFEENAIHKNQQERVNLSAFTSGNNVQDNKEAIQNSSSNIGGVKPLWFESTTGYDGIDEPVTEGGNYLFRADCNSTVNANKAEQPQANGSKAIAVDQGGQVVPEVIVIKKEIEVTETKPSNEEVIEQKTLPDGTIVKALADGTIVHELPDGSIKREFPDGTIEKESPDGTITRQLPDGTIVEILPNPVPEEGQEETVVSINKGIEITTVKQLASDLATDGIILRKEDSGKDLYYLSRQSENPAFDNPSQDSNFPALIDFPNIIPISGDANRGSIMFWLKFNREWNDEAPRTLFFVNTAFEITDVLSGNKFLVGVQKEVKVKITTVDNNPANLLRRLELIVHSKFFCKDKKSNTAVAVHPLLMPYKNVESVQGIVVNPLVNQGVRAHENYHISIRWKDGNTLTNFTGINGNSAIAIHGNFYDDNNKLLPNRVAFSENFPHPQNSQTPQGKLSNGAFEPLADDLVNENRFYVGSAGRSKSPQATVDDLRVTPNIDWASTLDFNPSRQLPSEEIYGLFKVKSTDENGKEPIHTKIHKTQHVENPPLVGNSEITGDITLEELWHFFTSPETPLPNEFESLLDLNAETNIAFSFHHEDHYHKQVQVTLKNADGTEEFKLDQDVMSFGEAMPTSEFTKSGQTFQNILTEYYKYMKGLEPNVTGTFAQPVPQGEKHIRFKKNIGEPLFQGGAVALIEFAYRSKIDFFNYEFK
ncbi:T-complex 10 C-terminal domain-containing protein [Candidatus Uabimicrobium amorphum]|uniref:Centromere protein J C-terminal domain-containing protein n=1 Tax=Uabimicrobium amorphum TaxID=2596890 RepID=A0A5S9INS8_UABAM|nr:T-complex 10 C-terminal domain-containing protein [Candidatus Uabimicrobium amorphum]BBM85313.1 hypothetical protein UABAM_03679 [Candidatus Uabimicrobium amorphum]